VHRFSSILTGVFIAIHGASLLLDQVVSFSLFQVLVRSAPRTGHSRSGWASLPRSARRGRR